MDKGYVDELARQFGVLQIIHVWIQNYEDAPRHPRTSYLCSSLQTRAIPDLTEKAAGSRALLAKYPVAIPRKSKYVGNDGLSTLSSKGEGLDLCALAYSNDLP